MMVTGSACRPTAHGSGPRALRVDARWRRRADVLQRRATQEVRRQQQQRHDGADRRRKTAGWDITSKLYVCAHRQRAGMGRDRRHRLDAGQRRHLLAERVDGSSASSRNGAFDPTTGCLWRFYNFRQPGPRVLRLRAQDREGLQRLLVGLLRTGRRVFMDLGLRLPPRQPSSATARSRVLLERHRGPYRTYGEFSWEHKATARPEQPPVRGEPRTGYLWASGRAARTPPAATVEATLRACRCARAWWDKAHSTADSGRCVRTRRRRMKQPAPRSKGGLLYLSCNHHDSGVSGEPQPRDVAPAG